jgi:release factor glutamine methyltransferase
VNGVYRPGEDSLFLCKSVESIRVAKVVEVGVGSGFVLRHYVRTNSPALAVGTDIAIDAVKTARNEERSDSAEFVLCQSCDSLREGSFQLAFFNPPYLKDDVVEDATTSGGTEGVEVTYEMACSSYRVLAPGGRMVFLVSSLSDVDLLLSRLFDAGMETIKLGMLKLFFEELYAFKVTKAEVSQKSL